MAISSNSTTTIKSDREHSFDHELAWLIGVEKALLMKNFNFWVTENKRRNQKGYFSNGFWWTEESLNSLCKKYRYFSRSSIDRWVNELLTDGWLIIEGEKGKTNRYRPASMFYAWQRLELSQNETVTKADCLKMIRVLSQNEIVNPDKKGADCPKTAHNNIDNLSSDNIDLDIDNLGAAAPVLTFWQRFIKVFEAHHEKHFTKDGIYTGFMWGTGKSDTTTGKQMGGLKGLEEKLRAGAEKLYKRPGTDDEIIFNFDLFLTLAAEDDFTLKNWFTPFKLNDQYQQITNKINIRKDEIRKSGTGTTSNPGSTDNRKSDTPFRKGLGKQD